MAALAVAVTPAGPAAAHSDPGLIGSTPSGEADFAALESAVDKMEGSQTPDVNELPALVPQSVYDEFPDYDDVVRGGGNVPALGQSGATIPPCPAQGTRLLPGFPAPYGYYQPATTNNWCLPNGPNGGCDVVPDYGLTYDFRNACRQHDLGYQWAPTERSSVDLMFLSDMGADCVRRIFWQQPFCYVRAAIRYAAVRVFGGPAYGNSPRPGYNQPVPPTGVPPQPADTTCAQSSHAWLYYPPGGSSIPRGAPVYLTGVVRRHSRIQFEFRDSAGVLVATHLTYFAAANCVVAHEPERFDTTLLPVGPITVTATYPRWEVSDEVTQALGTYTISAGGGSTTCLQYTHVWVYTGAGGGNTIVRGRTIWPTGVVRRGTRVQFNFYDSTGALFAIHLTATAGSNCVINHEPEAHSTLTWPLGSVRVEAIYTEWETDQVVTRDVGTLTVLAPPPPPPPPPCLRGLRPDPCDP